MPMLSRWAVGSIARGCSRTLRAGAAILAASSYFAYTTAGFDFESATSAGPEVTYYRLRWDDGATWIGVATQPVPQVHRPPDWFDPGGTLLAPPTRPDRLRPWNRWGLWWIGRAVDDPYVATRYPGARASRWAAAPSWLVILAAGLPEVVARSRRFRAARAAAGDSAGGIDARTGARRRRG